MATRSVSRTARFVGKARVDAEGELHFTVGSLRHTGRRRKVDFRGELGLLKAALLYADRVQLVSVGASTVAAFDKLGNLSTQKKLDFVRQQLPEVYPNASPQEL